MEKERENKKGGKGGGQTCLVDEASKTAGASVDHGCRSQLRFER